MLPDARWILGLAREPAAEAVVGFQVTYLPLVAHRILQDADQAHGYRWPRVILRLIELPRELFGGQRLEIIFHPFVGCVMVVEELLRRSAESADLLARVHR